MSERSGIRGGAKRPRAKDRFMALVGLAGAAACSLSERASFSPPRSKVRTVTGLPFIPRTSAENTAYCSSSPGKSSRFI